MLKDAIVAGGAVATASADQARFAAALGRVTQGAWMLLFLPFALLLLVYPDGSFVSRRWRAVAAALVAVVVAFCLLGAVSPAVSANQSNDDDPMPFVAVVLLALFLGLLIACAVGPVMRYRSSTGQVRLQLRWLALGGAGLPLTLLLGWVSGLLFGVTDAFDLVLLVIYVAIPAAVAIAILRHDLYDVDRAIVATGTYAVLVGAILVIVAATSAIVGLVAGRASTVITVAVTAATALALGPSRNAAQRWVRRVLFPARDRALRSIGDLLALVQAGRARPERVEAVLSSAVDDPGLRVGYRVPDGDEFCSRSGEPVIPARNATDVWLSDRRIGVLIPGDPTAPALSKDIASAAALLIEMVRLRIDLTAALAEVAASRERLLGASYSERRRLEQDLHDGAQQRLVSLGMALRLTQRHLDDGSVDVDEVLDEAVSELGTAVAELRQIAHGLRPSSLDDGLAAALTNLSRRSSIPVELSVDVGTLPDLISTTAYFVANEAVANAVKHSAAHSVRVTVSSTEGSITLTVTDDGQGGAEVRSTSGLAGLFDRVSARGWSPAHPEPSRPWHDHRGGAPMRIVIGEDSVLFREGLSRLLIDHGHQVLATAGDAAGALAAIRATTPDLAILDIRMPPEHFDDGARVAATARSEFPNLGIVLLSQHVETRHSMDLVASGRFGYLLKDRVLDLDDFMSALTRVAGGGSALDPDVVAQLLFIRKSDSALRLLTPRETDVLALMAEGRTNTAIAKRLFLTARTVETHISSILGKLRLPATADDHRRVLAVITYLNSRGEPSDTALLPRK